MKMWRLLPMVFTVTCGSAFFAGCVSTHLQETVDENDAEPVEFERVVELDRDLHFLSSDGADIVLSAGGYYVDLAQEGLRLKSADQEESKAVVVQAEEIQHGQSIEVPEAVSVREGEDQQVVMVLMPDGTARQALGTSSGIQTRGGVSAFKLGPGILEHMPKVSGIFTVPKLGAVTPGGSLYQRRAFWTFKRY